MKNISEFIKLQQVSKDNQGNELPWEGKLQIVCENVIDTSNGRFEGTLLKHPEVEEYCVAEWFTDHSGYTSPAGAMYKQSIGVTPQTFAEYCQKCAIELG